MKLYFKLKYYLLRIYLIPRCYGSKKNNLTIGSLKLSGLSYIFFSKTSIHNKIQIGHNVTAKNLAIVFTGDNNTLIIADNVTWSGQILIHCSNRTVKIGQNSRALNVYLVARDKNITIGENCLFSRGIEIRATDVHKIYDKDSHELLNKSKEVYIGDNVWVAAKVTISKGSYIPNWSVIGANSFVNSAFKLENTIIAGIPAKIVKKNIYWKR